VGPHVEEQDANIYGGFTCMATILVIDVHDHCNNSKDVHNSSIIVVVKDVGATHGSLNCLTHKNPLG